MTLDDCSNPWIPALSTLLITLDHLPTSKSRNQSTVTRLADLQLPDSSPAVIHTQYPENKYHLSRDGEVMTVLILTTLQKPDHEQIERVYLDENLEKQLGQLQLTSTSLLHLLERLSQIKHSVYHPQVNVQGNQPPAFTAGKLVNRTIPYFELSEPMVMALDHLRQTGSYPHINLQRHASIKTPLARRLYRFFYRQGLTDTEIDVPSLAAALGIFSGPAPQSTEEIRYSCAPVWHHLHQSLQNATQELLHLRVLEDVRYPKPDGQYRAIFDFNPAGI